MVIDDSCDENKPFSSLSEYNRHLECALPEIYMEDIYKYLRDCEVNIKEIKVWIM